MKLPQRVRVALVAFICFILGCWLFLPWGALSGYALTKIQTAGAENGVYVSVIRLEQSGRILPVFRFEGVEIQHEAGGLAIDSLTVRLLPLSSLLNRSVTCRVETGEAQLKTFPQNESGWRTGSLLLSLSPSRTTVTNINFEGDLSLKGYLEMASGTLARADFSLKVPPALDGSIRMIAPMISLESTASGEWRMKKDAPAGP